MRIYKCSESYYGQSGETAGIVKRQYVVTFSLGEPRTKIHKCSESYCGVQERLFVRETHYKLADSQIKISQIVGDC